MDQVVLGALPPNPFAAMRGRAVSRPGATGLKREVVRVKDEEILRKSRRLSPKTANEVRFRLRRSGESGQRDGYVGWFRTVMFCCLRPV